jgi:hypothetical protein
MTRKTLHLSKGAGKQLKSTNQPSDFMQTYDIAAFWSRFPKTVLAISKLDLEHTIYSPSPDKHPDKAVYETYRQLICCEAILNDAH